MNSDFTSRLFARHAAVVCLGENGAANLFADATLGEEGIAFLGLLGACGLPNRSIEAQLEARFHGMKEVLGSNPIRFNKFLARLGSTALFHRHPAFTYPRFFTA